ncbi:hypothetical protein D9M73_76520 [compost metagenome]|jgi:hypothetical protein
MAWLTENWFWILTFIAFIAMHMFGHGGHGSHGGGDRERSANTKEAGAAQSRSGDARSGGHHH